VKGDTLIMDGLIASVDGRRLIRDTIQGPASEAKGLGKQLAEILLAQGGDVILNEIYGNT